MKIRRAQQAKRKIMSISPHLFVGPSAPCLTVWHPKTCMLVNWAHWQCIDQVRQSKNTRQRIHCLTLMLKSQDSLMSKQKLCYKSYVQECFTKQSQKAC